jgi:hypothetical protein
MRTAHKLTGKRQRSQHIHTRELSSIADKIQFEDHLHVGQKSH